MNYICIKIFIYTFIPVYSLMASANSCHSAQNLALNKKYTISPPANYMLAAPINDKTSLTDGKYAVGRFWSQKKTVGWSYIKSVEIMIDLGEEANIGRIIFSTARGINAGVHFPANIFVFVGATKESFLYIDDIMNDHENVFGIYKVKKFISNNINLRGRFILLIVVLKGAFLFCDEIEILEGAEEKAITGNLSIENARIIAEEKRRLSIGKKILSGLTDKYWKAIGVNSEFSGYQKTFQERISNISSLEDVALIEKDLFKHRGTVLRDRFPAKNILIETVNPWDNIYPLYLPSGVPPKNVYFTIPQKGYDHAAFMITNLSPEDLQITVSLSMMMEEAPDLSIYEVPYVKSAALEYVADPMIPMAENFTMSPGTSHMLFLTVHGKKLGTWQTSMKIVSGDLITLIPINIKVSNVELPSEFSLNSVVWDELNFKITNDRKTDAVDDLSSHHTNVVVVPYEYLPIPEIKNDPFFNRLENYLKIYKNRNISKVLLFLHFGSESRSTVNGRYIFMEETWKIWFRDWFEKIMLACEKAGFSKERVYLYPFDEVAGRQLDMLGMLSSWCRREIPEVNLYSTIDLVQSLKSIQYVDIAQVVPKLLDRIGSTKPEIWMYDTKGPSKSNSPYSYYRLMSWKAFSLGLKGVGFWAYADAGKGDNAGSAWDDFDGRRADYAVIYEGDGNSIISSRRWEAWRIGIEDYELLLMYAKAQGSKSAKALAEIVLDHPEDTKKADEVRRKILIDLSNKENN